MKLLPLLVAATAGTAILHGNTITPSTVSFTPGSNIIYAADLTSGEMASGDGFTIFDIGGFLSFGAIPANWTAQATITGSPLTGPNVPTPLGADNPALQNVTFTYTGATIEMGLGLMNLGQFVVNTSSTTLVTDDWVSRDHLLGNMGVIDGAFGPGDRANIVVPAGSVTVSDSGSTFILLSVALTGIGYLRRRLA